jgi:predicted oxidoreductase
MENSVSEGTAGPGRAGAPALREASRDLAYGCWRLAVSGDPATDHEKAGAAVDAALEAGIRFFDHADIYCGGRSESVFGGLLAERTGLREQIRIGSKCGIRLAEDIGPGAPYRYDSSYSHIVTSCEGSLRRLGVETLDLFQIHRPDFLMNPEEVARAFEELHRSGKVREFGVSNFRPSQVELLQAYLGMPLVVNQVEVSLLQLAAFEDGTLDQCVRLRIRPMAWSPLGAGLLGDGGVDLLPGQRGYRPQAVAAALGSVAQKLGQSGTAVALAWLLAHPAGIIPIIGSTKPSRIREAAGSVRIRLGREDWYELFTAARGGALP